MSRLFFMSLAFLFVCACQSSPYDSTPKGYSVPEEAPAEPMEIYTGIDIVHMQNLAAKFDSLFESDDIDNLRVDSCFVSFSSFLKVTKAFKNGSDWVFNRDRIVEIFVDNLDRYYYYESCPAVFLGKVDLDRFRQLTTPMPGHTGVIFTRVVHENVNDRFPAFQKVIQSVFQVLTYQGKPVAVFDYYNRVKFTYSICGIASSQEEAQLTNDACHIDVTKHIEGREGIIRFQLTP